MISTWLRPTRSNAATALAHRVAAADGVDEALAEELEMKALHDLELGYKIEAARTLQWSSALSASGGDAQRRLVRAAWAYLDGGQVHQAQALRAEIEAVGLEPGRSLVLGLLEWESGHAENSRQFLQRVVGHEGPDGGFDTQATTARAWAELAEIHIVLSQAREAADAAARALALSSPHTSAERLAHMHGALAEGNLEGAAAGLARLRQRLPQPADGVAGEDVDLLVARATLALFAGLTHEALVDLRAIIALAQRGFIPVQLARTHRQLGMALLAVGEWDEALVQARTGLGLADDDLRGTEQAACQGVIATVLAYRGSAEQAETHVSAAADTAARFGAVEAMALTWLAAAAVAVASADPQQVIETLEPMRSAPPMLAALNFWPTLATALIEDRAARPCPRKYPRPRRGG